MRHRIAVWAVSAAIVGTSLVAAATPAMAEERPGGNRFRPGRDGTSQGPAGAKHHRARRALRHSLKGEVTAVTEDGFTLKTRRGPTIKIQTTDETKFRGGAESDLSVGDKVAVIPACKPDPDKAKAEGDRKKKQRRDALRACVSGNEGSRTLKARAVLFPPGGSFRKDAVPSGKARFSA